MIYNKTSNDRTAHHRHEQGIFVFFCFWLLSNRILVLTYLIRNPDRNHIGALGGPTGILGMGVVKGAVGELLLS